MISESVWFLAHEIFAPGFTSLDMLQYILVYSLWELEFVFYCENCINLNYIELVHGTFQVYLSFYFFYIFSLLIFEIFILKLQLKILIYLLKNNCNI